MENLEVEKDVNKELVRRVGKVDNSEDTVAFITEFEEIIKIKNKRKHNMVSASKRKVFQGFMEKNEIYKYDHQI